MHAIEKCLHIALHEPRLLRQMAKFTDDSHVLESAY